MGDVFGDHPPRPQEWKCGSDLPGRKFAEAVRVHQLALGAATLMTEPHHIAVNIADGSSDGHTYPSPADAVRANRHVIGRLMPWRVTPDPFSDRVADLMLWTARMQYEAGRPDPRTLLDTPTLIGGLHL